MLQKNLLKHTSQRLRIILLKTSMCSYIDTPSFIENVYSLFFKNSLWASDLFMHKASTLFQMPRAVFSSEISLRIESLRLKIRVLWALLWICFIFSLDLELPTVSGSSSSKADSNPWWTRRALIFIFQSEKSPPMGNFSILCFGSDIVAIPLWLWYHLLSLNTTEAKKNLQEWSKNWEPTYKIRNQILNTNTKQHNSKGKMALFYCSNRLQICQIL